LNHNRPMMARLSAFVIWALVAAAMVFWGMRLVVQAAPVPLNAAVVGESTSARGDLSRLFGAEPVAQVAAAPAASSRFRLLGVMAAKPGREGSMTPGVALISIDGKPARAFTAGARIEEQLVLQNVSLRTASIGVDKGPTSFVLELPALPPPATGTLPRPVMDGAPGAAAAPAPVPVLSPRPAPSPAAAPVPPAQGGQVPPPSTSRPVGAPPRGVSPGNAR
jgi:general secretion pathway protein C